MDKISQFLENKTFIDWIFDPSPELDTWWENYKKENPQEKANLLLAQKVVSKFRTKDINLSETEKIVIFSKILKDIEENHGQTTKFRLAVAIMRYAAVALLFFALGSLLFYQRDYSNPQFFTQDLTEPVPGDVTTLIRPGGQSIKTVEDNSTFVYQSTNKKLVINDTLEIESVAKTRENSMSQLIVPFGKTSQVVLADGTQVYLNAGSRLVYPEEFTGEAREVFLTGEAFFEVQKDKEHPFIVQTSDIHVKVLGTKFNLMAYASDPVCETVLTEGKVRIRQNKAGIFDQTVNLEPNQIASFDRTLNKAEVRIVNVENYILWKDGMLKFESTDLSRVVKKLERFYNIRFYMHNPEMGQMKISGKLELKGGKVDVLDVLANTASVSIIKKGENYYEINE